MQLSSPIISSSRRCFPVLFLQKWCSYFGWRTIYRAALHADERRAVVDKLLAILSELLAATRACNSVFTSTTYHYQSSTRRGGIRRDINPSLRRLVCDHLSSYKSAKERASRACGLRKTSAKTKMRKQNKCLVIACGSRATVVLLSAISAMKKHREACRGILSRCIASLHTGVCQNASAARVGNESNAVYLRAHYQNHTRLRHAST